MSKNIAVCYDGTGNEYGPNVTNVVHAFEMLLRDDEQVAFYDPGVGTFSFLGQSYFGRTASRWLGTNLGKAFGLGLVQNIEDAYVYLMDTFVPGDRVFIFGFSRGAFQARVLADYLHKIGVLQKGSRNLVPYATRLYFTPGNKAVAEGFKEIYCHPCPSHFVGVWDTVASLGHFFGKRFTNNKLNGDVKFAYHAVAIDEQRKKFAVSLWDETNVPKGQTLEQVWFPGVHSDVGGWYSDRGLSDIALTWMLENAERAGLRLRDGWRDHVNPNADGELHESRQGFWKLWAPAPREIPEGAKIHGSVQQRMSSGDYNPPLPPR